MLEDAGAHATFFTLGWVAERYPVTGPPDRRSRATSSRATATSTCGPPTRRYGRVPRGHLARQGGARGRRGTARCAAIARRASPIGTGESRGPSTASPRQATATAPASIPIRHDHYGGARRAALRPRGAPGPPRGAGDHGADAGEELAGGRRRLFPVAAVWRVTLDAAARERGRRPARDLLLPPVGARPRAAPRRPAQA